MKCNPNIFIYKPMNILINIYRATDHTSYNMKIYKEANITYSYIHFSTKEMLKQKILIARQKGRIRYLTLTKKGIKIAEKIIEINKIMDLGVWK